MRHQQNTRTVLLMAGKVASVIFFSVLSAGPVSDIQAQINSASQESNRAESEVLFDGTDLKKWRGYKSAKIGKGWKIVDDVLYFDGSGGGDIITKDKYADFELTLEWKVDPGSNSGIMYRVSTGDPASYYTGPEYQILDNEKHDDGNQRLTSAASLYGLYEVPKNIQPKPAGKWNSTKIVIREDKVEHWLNGKKAVSVKIGSDDWNEKVAGSKFAKWKKFGKNKSGHICLQDHENKVWFRNIRIKRLPGKSPSDND